MKSRFMKKRKAAVDMKRLFMTFLLIIFGLALTPSIGNLTYDALWNDTNVTIRVMRNITNSAARAIIDLVPLVWVFVIVGIGAAAVIEQFKDI